MLEALNSIVEFLSMITSMIGDVVYALPVFLRVIISSFIPFLTYQQFMPVYFIPFISFTVGGTILLLILKRGNNRG